MYYPERHGRNLAKALLIATTSTQRQKHGCVIAKGNRVLAVGVNVARNIPSNAPPPDAAVHAEIMAIRALPAGIDFSRLTLYVARVGRNGLPALSKPCARCALAIEELGFKEVYHT